MSDFNLQLKNIYYKYPVTENYALDDVNLKISSGEKVVVLGENGTGKSTLFLLANGVYPPTSGDIILNGKKINRNKGDLMELRKSIGLVFQDPETQFIAPTVEEEISFGPFNLGKNNEEVNEIVDEVTRILGIEKLRKKSLYALSGGEKKLVSIASVLALDPKIMIFDEPTAGLDYKNSVIYKNALSILESKGLGLVISTHDINFAWEWSERVIILKNGKVYAQGNTVEILSDQEILDYANLEKPTIIQIMDMLNLQKDMVPRNFSELESLLKSN